MPDAATFWPPDTAGRIGDVAGFLGFLGTVYVALTTSKIKSEVQRRARLPEILDALESLAANFTAHLTPGSDVGERVKMIGQAEGLLNSLKSYSDRGERESIAIVAAKIVVCKGQSPSQADLLSLNGEFYRLIEELRDRVRRG